jgi:hypothetical protein
MPLSARDIAEYAREADEGSRDHTVGNKYSKGEMSFSPPPGIQYLRAYRHFHPATRVHIVEANGRTVWLTDKQYDIWCYVRASHHRATKLHLADIAAVARCSRATVSRFLTRLDLWRFVDVISRVGRKGYVWIRTRKAPSTTMEQDANLAGARHTLKSRRIARDRMWLEFRRHIEDVMSKKIASNRPRVPVEPNPVMGGSTDATFMPLWGPEGA